MEGAEGSPSEEYNWYGSHRGIHRSVWDGVMNAPPLVRQVSAEDANANVEEAKFPYDEKDETVETIPTIPYNTKALSKRELTYKLETFKKNYLVVFNQENIEGYKPRRGTEKDVEALENTFSKFGFEVEVHTDFTKAEILDALKIFREKDFTEYGCVAVAVLTHGTYDGLLRAQDQQYSETEIINHFKTHDKPTLVTKPKLLIIQACRGARSTRGVLVHAGNIHKDVDDDQGYYSLPVESDMLILHSSYTGNPSHRDELHGTWLIQALCREIERLSPAVDVESIMTEVKKAVAIDMEHEVYNKVTGDMDINKQMPVTSSTLIRKLYFKEYSDRGPRVTLRDGGSGSAGESLRGATPGTPSSAQTAPCLCFVPHFDYLRQCLRHIVEENPEDERAVSYLEVCETFEDVNEFNGPKRNMVRLISQYLEKKAPDIEYFKYIYLHRNE